MSKSIKVLHDSNGNKYTITEDNLHTIASNQIYKSVENPDIYIKVIKHEYFSDLEAENVYIRQKIENELGIAKLLSDNFFPVPHVYHASVDIGTEFITGYIVMDRIDGKIISSLEEFDQYFDKIFAVLGDLLEFGVVYNDLNINNFIISREDNEVYLLDFEEAVREDGPQIPLNKEFIQSQLRESVKTRMEFGESIPQLRIEETATKKKKKTSKKKKTNKKKKTTKKKKKTKK